MKVVQSIVALSLAGVLLAACDPDTSTSAASAQPTSAPTETPAVSPSGTVATTPPTVPATGNGPSVKPPTLPPGARDEISVVGVVTYSSVEGGCWGLKVGSATYELLGGDRSILTEGRRVMVRGVARSDVATVCQIGIPLQVLSARAA